MNNGNRIPTPWKHQWRRFRYSVMPAISFTVVLIVTLWFSGHQGVQPNLTGEINAERIDVAAGIDGKIIDGEVALQLFQNVAAGEVIARLDSEGISAELNVLRAQREEFSLQIGAEQAKIKLDHAGMALDHAQELRRLRYQLEERRLDVLDRMASIAEDRIEETRLAARVQVLEKLHEQDMVQDMELNDAILLRNEVKTRIERETVAYNAARQLVTQAEKRLSELPVPSEAASEVVDAILAPIAQGIRVQEQRIAALDVRTDQFVIRSPVNGRILEIYSRPGQFVQAGDPIVAIAPVGSHIVTYVRQDQRLDVVENQPVLVRRRGPATAPVESKITAVSPQYESLPTHFLRDPTIPEWGLRVLVAIPRDFFARAGEPLDLTVLPLETAAK